MPEAESVGQTIKRWCYRQAWSMQRIFDPSHAIRYSSDKLPNYTLLYCVLRILKGSFAEATATRAVPGNI